MKIRMLCSLVSLLAYSACVEAGTMTFDAAADFSTSSNPNGAWTYGYCDPNAGISTFTAFTYETDWSGRDQSLPTIKAWQRTSTSTDPSVSCNTSDNSVTGYTYTWAPHAIGLSSYGDLSPVVRWQAPVAGTVDITATFTDMGATSTTAFFIDGPGTVWFAQATTASGVTYSNLSNPANTKMVGAGDYVYFATDGHLGSVTQFSATLTLTPVPEPSSVILSAVGLVGLFAFGWRRNQ